MAYLLLMKDPRANWPLLLPQADSVGLLWSSLMYYNFARKLGRKLTASVTQKKSSITRMAGSIHNATSELGQRVTEIMLWVWLEIEHQFESQLSKGALEHLHNNKGY